MCERFIQEPAHTGLIVGKYLLMMGHPNHDLRYVLDFAPFVQASRLPYQLLSDLGLLLNKPSIPVAGGELRCLPFAKGTSTSKVGAARVASRDIKNQEPINRYK